MRRAYGIRVFRAAVRMAFAGVRERYRNARHEDKRGCGFTQLHSRAEIGDVGEDPGSGTGVPQDGTQHLLVVPEDGPCLVQWFGRQGDGAPVDLEQRAGVRRAGGIQLVDGDRAPDQRPDRQDGSSGPVGRLHGQPVRAGQNQPYP